MSDVLAQIVAAKRVRLARGEYAGGLDAETVGDVIRRLRPAGVDVASGVESAPGVKDPNKLSLFFAAVREADAGPG